MSIAIYNGFFLHNTTSFSDTFCFVKNLKKRLLEDRDKILAEYAADTFLKIYHSYLTNSTQEFIDKLKEDYNFLSHNCITDILNMSFWNICCLIIENGVYLATPSGKKYRNDHSMKPLYLDANLTLYSHDNKTYGTVNFDKTDYYPSLWAMPNVDEFNYWDNSDMPTDITEDNWDIRRKTWVSICTETLNLSDSGITISLFDRKPLRTESRRFRLSSKFNTLFLSYVGSRESFIEKMANFSISQNSNDNDILNATLFYKRKVTLQFTEFFFNTSILNLSILSADNN